MIRDLKEIYSDISSYLDKSVTIQGWIRNHRKQKTIGFIDFNDGTSFKGIQIVYDENIKEFDEIQKLHVGASISATGRIIKSSREEQPYEMVLETYKLEGDCPEDYPIQPKRHTREFLREQAYRLSHPLKA